MGHARFRLAVAVLLFVGCQTPLFGHGSSGPTPPEISQAGGSSTFSILGDSCTTVVASVTANPAGVLTITHQTSGNDAVFTARAVTLPSQDTIVTITVEWTTNCAEGSGRHTFRITVRRAPAPVTGRLEVQPRIVNVSTAARTAASFPLSLTEVFSSPSSASGADSAGSEISGGERDSATVNWTAAVTHLNGGTSWLTISLTSGSVTAPQSTIVTGQVNTTALPGPGVYQALIVFTDTTNNRTITVTVNVTVTSTAPQLVLSQQSFFFSAAQGGAAPPSETLRIFNVGGSNAEWTISGMPPWLAVSPASGTATNNPAQISQTRLTANPAGLAAGVHQALLSVSAPGAGSDALVAVTLQVVAPSASPVIVVTPFGLVFKTVVGMEDPPPQTITISNAGGGAASFVVQPSTTNGGPWLSASLTSGGTSSGPVAVQISANTGSLPAGVYRGKIAIVPTPGTTIEVDVTLIVASGTVISFAAGDSRSACTPSGLELVGTTLGSGLSVPVSFPRPVLALAVDTCGSAVSNASVLATFGATNITLQPLGSGLYTGVWVPSQAASSVPVTLTAQHPSFPTVARRTFTVSATAAAGGIELPLLSPDGVVEGAGFTSRRPLAPGSIVSLFGLRFGGNGEGPTRIPLDTELAGIGVRIGRYSAPLFFTGAGQINAQIPLEVAPGETVSIVVNSRGRLTVPQTYTVAPVQPGVFTSCQGACILDARDRVISAQNPAFIGDTVVIYGTGMGQTDPPAETGKNTGVGTMLRSRVTVTIGGQAATIVYQGLAPGFVGLNQINVVIPAGVVPGDAVPVVLTQNGITSNSEPPPLTMSVRAR